MERKRAPLFHLLAAGAFALLGLAACATSPAAPAPGARGGDPLERRTAAATADAVRLQGELMALTDTALARFTAETEPGTVSRDPAVRKFSLYTRLTLGTSLMAIVTGPDPVDALLDMLTHTTLVADAMRHNEAKGKAPDSVEGRVLRALELNEADAWKLAERWLDAPTRSALRERILGYAGERRSAAAVAYVRLSDVPRTGSASADAGEGMISSLRAAVQQAEQARLLGERSLFLAQRMPYALRWQAEVLAHSMLTADEVRRMLEQTGSLAAVADSAVREVAGMPAQLSRERADALQDMFARIERERRGTLEHLALVVQKERSETLASAGAFISSERRAIIDELNRAVGRAEERGVHWAGIALLIGFVLIAALLMGSLGTGLLYRHLVRRREGRYPALSGTSPPAPVSPAQTGKS